MLHLMRSTTSSKARVKVGAQRRQRHLAETR